LSAFLLLAAFVALSSIPVSRAQSIYFLDPTNQQQSTLDCAAIGGGWDGASACIITSSAGLGPSAGGSVSINATYSGDKTHNGSFGSSQLAVGSTAASSSSGSSTTTSSSSSSTTTSTTATSTGGGAGIPEFSPGILAAVLFAALLLISYFVVRLRSERQNDNFRF